MGRCTDFLWYNNVHSYPALNQGAATRPYRRWAIPHWKHSAEVFLCLATTSTSDVTKATILDHAGIVLGILRTLKRGQHCETQGPTGQSRSIIGPRRTGEASGLVQAANDQAPGASR